MIANKTHKTNIQAQDQGGPSGKRPKRTAGRPVPRLPAPTPEEIRDARLRANLSQVQACELVGISEVMTWSKYESRREDGEPKSRIDPIRWAHFLLMIGLHPGLVLIPRLGVEKPQATTAQRRRGPSLPDKDVSFAIEQLHHGYWSCVDGDRFTTLTAACAAIHAMDECFRIKKKRVRRYLDGDPAQVIAHSPRKHPFHSQPKRYSAARYPTPYPIKRRL